MSMFSDVNEVSKIGDVDQSPNIWGEFEALVYIKGLCKGTNENELCSNLVTIEEYRL